MSNSLRDQLLKAGLVTRDQANRAAAKSRRKQKPRKGPESEDSARERQVRQEIAAAERSKQTRDRDLNRNRDQARAVKARRAELRKQLRETHKNDGKGEITHYFQFGRKVRQVMVTSRQQEQLVAGDLGIVVMDGITYLVERSLADTVQRDDPDACVVIHDGEDSAAVDDEYKDYVIPDDLQW